MAGNRNKVFDLAFYEGFNTENRILYSQQLLNALPWGKAVYPFPEFQTDVGFPAVDVSADGVQISKKIQNNNLILSDGSPAEALLLIGIPSQSMADITIDTKVAHKNVGGEGTYEFFDFTFTYTGRAQTGTIKGLTAFNITLSDSAFGGTDTWYVGFVGGIGSYNFLGTTLPTEGSLVSLSQLIIVDLAVDNSTELIYIIEKDAFYSLNFGTTALTSINVKGFSTATNYVGVATDDVFVYIAATNDGKSVVIVYEIATGNFFEVESPFSDQSVPFTRIIYERGISTFSGTQRPVVICSNGAGAAMSASFDIPTVSFPSQIIIDTTTQPNLANNVVTDVSQRTTFNAGGPDHLGIVFTTSAGLNLATQTGAAVSVKTVLEGSKSFGRVTVTGTNVSGVSTGFTNFVVTETAPDFNFTVMEGDVGIPSINLQQSFAQTTVPLAVSSQRSTVSVTSRDNYWLGTLTGQGVITSTSTPATIPNLVLTILSDTYDLVLKDIIKADIDLYYFLVNEVGSSDIDANAVLLRFETDNDTLQAGLTGYFLPTDKLWLAGDVFILRNLEDQNSFYYKTITNLNLNETSGASAASQEEGLIQTTEAGNVVDLIYTRSLFYLLGTRGIEVWQNQGASGFPFRKESYLTIPYHLLPVSDENLYKFELNRWAYFKGGYAISTLSNEDNEYQIILVQSGKYQIFPLNKAAWYAALNQVGTSAPDDLTLDVVNMWGQEYIIISKINSRSIGSRSGAFIISEEGKIAALPDAISTQNQFLTATSTNGIRTVYNGTSELFTLEVAPQLPLTLAILPNKQLNSKLLNPFAENVLVKTVIIQYAFPIETVAAYPAGTFTISWSTDEGRNFIDILVLNEPWANHLTTRQLIYQINVTAPSFMLRFSTSSPIIIQSAVVTYQETGLRG